jgi:hypothetical protein
MADSREKRILWNDSPHIEIPPNCARKWEVLRSCVQIAGFDISIQPDGDLPIETLDRA